MMYIQEMHQIWRCDAFRINYSENKEIIIFFRINHATHIDLMYHYSLVPLAYLS